MDRGSEELRRIAPNCAELRGIAPNCAELRGGPIDSTVEMMKQMRIGKKYSGAKPVVGQGVMRACGGWDRNP